MVRIKRIKGDRVHYLAAVRPNGAAYGWSENPDRAAPLTDGMAAVVLTANGGRKNLGELSAESVDVAPADLSRVVATKEGVPAEDLAKLQAECKRLQAENATLKAQAKAAEGRAEQARLAEQRLTARLSNLEASFNQRGEELTRLKTALEKPAAKPNGDGAPTEHEEEKVEAARPAGSAAMPRTRR